MAAQGRQMLEGLCTNAAVRDDALRHLTTMDAFNAPTTPARSRWPPPWSRKPIRPSATGCSS